MNADHSEIAEDPLGLEDPSGSAPHYGWVPVALSADLPQGGVMRALMDSAEPLDLVVWRSRSGQPNAFDNRCPHRGMRLSFGFVRGERLSCIYHGWQYGKDGACRHIPAHPAMTPPTSIGANTYSCLDHDGVIWVSRDVNNSGDLPQFGGQALRSLSVNKGAEMLRKMLAETVLPISLNSEIQTAEASIVTQNPTSLVLEATSDAKPLRLMVHFQKITPDKTMLHIQTSPDLSADLQISLSRWAERFRWSAENLGTMINSWDDSAQEMHP